MANTQAIDKYFDTRDKDEAVIMRPTVTLNGNKV